MNSLDTLRQTAVRMLALGQFGHVLLVLLLGISIGAQSIMTSAAMSFLISAAGYAMLRLKGAGATTRYLIGAGYVLQAAVLVFVFRGHPWQIDMHMYFFAALAMASALFDWRAIVVAAGVTAVHHLLLNFVMPAWVFPEGVSFLRVILHAVIVVLETIVMLWLSLRFAQAFEDADAAKTEAISQAEHAQEAMRLAEEARAASDKALEDTHRMAAENEELREQRNAERLKSAEEARAQLNALASEFEHGIGALAGEIIEATGKLEKEGEALDCAATRARGMVVAAVEATNNVTENASSVAASAEEMAASVSEISRQVTRSRDITGISLEHVTSSMVTIRKMADYADKVTGIIDVIGDIAAQTNLLALNATIEAARAGEAGKGFAVVASEVKSLANESGSAARQIAEQLCAMQETSSEVVHMIERVEKDIQQISENAVGISAAVEEQDVATREIARAAQAASGETSTAAEQVHSINDVVDSVSRTVTSTFTSTQRLAKRTDELAARCQAFAAQIRAREIVA